MVWLDVSWQWAWEMEPKCREENLGHLKGLRRLCTSLLSQRAHTGDDNRDDNETNLPTIAQLRISGILLFRKAPSNPTNWLLQEQGAASCSTRTGPKPWVPKPGQHPHQHRSPSHQPRGSLLFFQAPNRAGTASPGAPALHQQHRILLLQPSLRNTSPIKLQKAILIKNIYIYRHF